MNKFFRYGPAVLVLGCLLVWPVTGRADEQTAGFQLSLFHPAQVYPDSTSIDGLGINLFYGVNEDFQGVDIGAFNQVKRDFAGLQLGLLANVTGRYCQGVQISVFYNNAEEELRGFQLGLVNYTGSLNGIQIGLLNFNGDTRYKGFLPFIEAAF